MKFALWSLNSGTGRRTYFILTGAYRPESWSIDQGHGFGSLAVLPNYQGKGIGMSLSQAGILRMKQIGYPLWSFLVTRGYYLRLDSPPPVHTAFVVRLKISLMRRL